MSPAPRRLGLRVVISFLLLVWLAVVEAGPTTRRRQATEESESNGSKKLSSASGDEEAPRLSAFAARKEDDDGLPLPSPPGNGQLPPAPPLLPPVPAPEMAPIPPSQAYDDDDKKSHDDDDEDDANLPPVPPELLASPFVSSNLRPAEMRSTNSKLNQCLSMRGKRGPESPEVEDEDLEKVVSEADARRKEGKGNGKNGRWLQVANSKDSYMVLLRESEMTNSLPYDVFEAHGVTSVKPMGSAGCFVATMDSTVASDLVSDNRVVFAVPVPPDYKKEPKTAFMLNTTTMEQGAGRWPQGTISFHITLTDDTGLDTIVANWKTHMAGLALSNSDLVGFALSTPSAITDSKKSSRYVVVTAPAALAKEVVDYLSQDSSVDWIEETPQLKPWNRWAKGLTQSANYLNKPISAIGLDGSGQIVGIADTGLDTSTCFVSDPYVNTPYNTISVNHRKIVTYITYGDNKENPDPSDNLGHGTHVTGSVAGQTTGSLSAYNGMAPNAKVAFFDFAKSDSTGEVALSPPPDLNQGMFMKLYSAGARILSNSWGSPDTNCYSSYSVMLDEFMYNKPDALIVIAAGNEGNGGAHTVSPPSTAKNCLTVGASLGMIDSTSKLPSTMNYVASFSSQGPTSDGRLKPDIVAPGYYITSAHNSETCNVVSSQGTSMATPVVAGNVALVRQYFMSGKYKGRPLLPSGALLKAMMIHSGQPMSYYLNSANKLKALTYPDNYQGYGRIQLDQVLDVNQYFTLQAYGSANTSDPTYRMVRQINEVHQYKVTVTANNATKIRPLKATLVWTDPPSSPTSCDGSLSSSVLINDLDLRIVDPKGNIAYPILQGGLAPDRVNNVEEVIITSPIPGGNYTIEVVARSLVKPQTYALVFTGHFYGQTYNVTEGSPIPEEPSLTLAAIIDHLRHNVVALGLAGVGVLLILALCYYSVHRRRIREPSRNPKQQQARYSNNQSWQQQPPPQAWSQSNYPQARFV